MMDRRTTVVLLNVILLCYLPNVIGQDLPYPCNIKPIATISADWHSWLEESEPIRIIGNHYFNETYDFPGKGTLKEPFMIENLYINLNKTKSTRSAIEIDHVDAHFTIRNCVFQGFNIWFDDPDGAWMSMLGMGIHLWDVGNGLIQNCTFLGSSAGVFINECENVSVYRNNKTCNSVSLNPQ
jgi:hypothetical protein